MLQTITASFLLISSPTGLSAPTRWFEHTLHNAWLLNHDPTLISPRIHSELSYEDLDEGEHKLKLETSLRWATDYHPKHTWGVQAMLPIVLDDPNHDAYFDNLELRTGVSGILSDGLRYGIAFNAELDTTSSQHVHDASSLILRPILAFAWDVTDTFNIGLRGEYSFTPYDEQENDERTLEIKLSLAHKISSQWSGSLTYKPHWDLLNHSDRHRLAASTTWNFGNQHQYALSFGLEIPLSEQELDYKFSTSISWFY